MNGDDAEERPLPRGFYGRLVPLPEGDDCPECGASPTEETARGRFCPACDHEWSESGAFRAIRRCA